MMSDDLIGQDSPFHCIEISDMCAVDPDMCSLYPDSMPVKSVPFSALDQKSFTVDGGKVYVNLEQPHFSRHASSPIPTQVLPNIETFSRISSPPLCDSTMSPMYDGNLTPPLTNSPPTSQFGVTPAAVRQTWRSKHPSSWTTEDVLDWVYYVAGDYKIDQYIEGEAFSEMTGQDLLAMSPTGFKALTAEHYMKFYEYFSQLKNRSNFKAPQDAESNPLLSSTSQHLQPDTSCQGQHPCYYNMNDRDSAVIQMNRFGYSVDLTDNFSEVTVHRALPETASCSDDGYSSGGSDNRNNIAVPSDDFLKQQQQQQQHHQQQQQMQPGGYYSSKELPIIPSIVQDQHMMNDDDEEEEDFCEQDPKDISDDKVQKPEGPVVSKRGRKLGQTTRGNHLWEFVRDLLKDERYSPALIKWENREKGVFRFVQSAQVAKMWGWRKNNQSMNYEKLSRAMRFCRGKEYFAELPKTEKYPKKLCFRFGARAHGWQTDD